MKTSTELIQSLEELIARAEENHCDLAGDTKRSISFEYLVMLRKELKDLRKARLITNLNKKGVTSWKFSTTINYL